MPMGPSYARTCQPAGSPECVLDAVVALTHEVGYTYEQDIEQVAGHEIARLVKPADLADNLANNLRPAGIPDVLDRIDRAPKSGWRKRTRLPPVKARLGAARQRSGSV